MPEGGKDHLQAVGLEIPLASFASRNDDERNQAPAYHETSDHRILAGSGWLVANEDLTRNGASPFLSKTRLESEP